MLWGDLLITPFITTYNIKSPGHSWELLATDMCHQLLLAHLSTVEVLVKTPTGEESESWRPQDGNGQAARFYTKRSHYTEGCSSSCKTDVCQGSAFLKT